MRAQRVMGCPDAVQVDLQRLAVVAEHSVHRHPSPQRLVVLLLDCPALRAVGVHPYPQAVQHLGRGERAGQRGVVQPLFQQARRGPRQGPALLRGTALDVAQEDRGVPGPFDVAQAEVPDPVRHDAGIGPEQQPVGDDHLGVRIEIRAAQSQPHRETHPVRSAAVRRDLAHPRPGLVRAAVPQQPLRVARRPAVHQRVLPRSGDRQRLAVGGVGGAGDRLARGDQPPPLRFAVRRQMPGVPRAEPRVGAAVDEVADIRPEHGMEVVGAAEHGPDPGLVAGPGRRHPVAREPGPAQVTGRTRKSLFRQLSRSAPGSRQVPADGACRVDVPVRVDQARQADQQCPGQAGVRRLDVTDGGRPVRQGERDARRVIDHGSGHQAPSPVSPNSSAASRPAAPSSSRPCSRPACT